MPRGGCHAVWEEAAVGPRRLEGGVLVDVQGYQVDAEGYRLNAAGARVQKVERAKLDVAFFDGEGRAQPAILPISSFRPNQGCSFRYTAGCSAGRCVSTVGCTAGCGFS